MLDAAEALAWGLVATVVPDDEVSAQALELAQRLADGPPGAGPDKRLLRARPRPRRAARRGGGRDRRVGGRRGRPGGIAAFRERRPPRFRPTLT
jgi:2-(1,2-epoxy-1,2-dihydrophenyl)acetyl-CoA isomerase